MTYIVTAISAVIAGVIIAGLIELGCAYVEYRWRCWRDDRASRRFWELRRRMKLEKWKKIEVRGAADFRSSLGESSPIHRGKIEGNQALESRVALPRAGVYLPLWKLHRQNRR